MRKETIILLLVMTCATACAHRQPDKRPEGRPHAAESRADWKRLGEAWVDGVRDRDVIAVGSREGAYRRIMIVVEHSALEMNDVVVNFADGSHFSPPTRLVFSENSRSQVIDLPGAQRVIRNVEFRYGNLPGGGRAQAELWAQ